MSSQHKNFLVNVLLLLAMFAIGVVCVVAASWCWTSSSEAARAWWVGIFYFSVALAIFAAFKHTRSAYDVPLKTAVLTSLFWLLLFLLIPALVLVVLGDDYLLHPLGRWWRSRRAARALERWWRGR